MTKLMTKEFFKYISYLSASQIALASGVYYGFFRVEPLYTVMAILLVLGFFFTYKTSRTTQKPLLTTCLKNEKFMIAFIVDFSLRISIAFFALALVYYMDTQEFNFTLFIVQVFYFGFMLYTYMNICKRCGVLK